MKIKLPKFGRTYVYHKDRTITFKLGFIKPKYITYLESHSILCLTYLDISINLPVAYIDEQGNDITIASLWREK